MGPLLTAETLGAMRAAIRAGRTELTCSVDLGRSTTTVTLGANHWRWNGERYAYPDRCKEHTIYHWCGGPFEGGGAFEPVARFGTSLAKLVPTEWGPPTFEIDGIKMLPTLRVSPYADAARKVELVQPRGKAILDTCAGLGYFAAWCLDGGAAKIFSFEKNPDVLWLRSLNPWSPAADARLVLAQGDVGAAIESIAAGSVDAVLHDPPRFSLAGELYSELFYIHLARVLKRRGRLFHYTGAPNRVSRGRDLSREVAGRLERAGFRTEFNGDGVFAVRR